MLRKCLLFGAALAIMGSGAGAADIAPVPAAFDWTGAYIGLSAGYMWGKVDYREPDFPGFGVNETDGSFIGGAYLGFNYQMDSIVLGAEVDGNLGGVDIDNDEDAEFNSYSAFDSDWNAHLRARIGFAADHALFYAAGGLAIADLTVDDTDDGFGKDTNTHFGWTIGGGVEFSVSDNLLIRAEYLYDDYGNEKYEIEGPDPAADYEARTSLTASIFRAGIAYKFPVP